MHLVAFITTIYHDARSPERQRMLTVALRCNNPFLLVERPIMT